MKIPERYGDIRDFFEGLQIAGELSDEFPIEIIKNKYKTGVQFLIRTYMGETRGFESSYYFQQGNMKNKRMGYFPFIVTMDRFKDEVTIHTTLPALIIDSSGERIFAGIGQIEKMYKNGYNLELSSKGFDKVEIKRGTYQRFDVNCILGENNGHEDISVIYEKVKKLSIDSFRILSR